MSDRRRKPPLDLTPALRQWREEETVRLLPWIRSMANASRLPFPADDLAQVGAIAVFEALPRFDAERGVALKTWLYRRVQGAFRDYARANGRLTKGGLRTKRTEYVHSLDAVAYQGRDRPVFRRDLLPDEHAEDPAAPSIADVADTAIRGCSDQERQAVRQVFVHGKTQEEASKAMGCVPSRVSRVLGMLFERLRKENPERVREACA